MAYIKIAIFVVLSALVAAYMFFKGIIASLNNVGEVGLFEIINNIHSFPFMILNFLGDLIPIALIFILVYLIYFAIILGLILLVNYTFQISNKMTKNTVRAIVAIIFVLFLI